MSRMPAATSTAATVRRTPKRSFNTSVPMTAAAITLVSRSAATSGERSPRLGPEDTDVGQDREAPGGEAAHREGRRDQAGKGTPHNGYHRKHGTLDEEQQAAVGIGVVRMAHAEPVDDGVGGDREPSEHSGAHCGQILFDNLPLDSARLISRPEKRRPRRAGRSRGSHGRTGRRPLLRRAGKSPSRWDRSG